MEAHYSYLSCIVVGSACLEKPYKSNHPKCSYLEVNANYTDTQGNVFKIGTDSSIFWPFDLNIEKTL